MDDAEALYTTEFAAAASETPAEVLLKECFAVLLRVFRSDGPRAEMTTRTLAPVAAKPEETPAAASGDDGFFVWFAAATLFFVFLSLRRRRAGKES